MHIWNLYTCIKNLSEVHKIVFLMKNVKSIWGGVHNLPITEYNVQSWKTQTEDKHLWSLIQEEFERQNKHFIFKYRRSATKGKNIGTTLICNNTKPIATWCFYLSNLTPFNRLLIFGFWTATKTSPSCRFPHKYWPSCIFVLKTDKIIIN